MRNMAAGNSDESKILIFCTPTQFVLQCDQWFHNGLKFFFHYFLFLERTFGWELSTSPCSFLFALHLEWSFNTSANKKSNEVFIFANLCSTLVCRLNFLQLGSTFCRNTQKKVFFGSVLWNQSNIEVGTFYRKC